MGTDNKYTGDETVDGGLIDSYVAGHAKSQLDESVGLRVGTVFDHQFAYGFVITNQLVQNQNIERCLRRMLSTKESMITEKFQMGMKALPVCSRNIIRFIENTMIYQARFRHNCINFIKLLLYFRDIIIVIY